MTHGYNSKTMILPTAASLLDLTNLSPAQEESAHLHQTTHGNAPVFFALGTVLADLNDVYNPSILFGRSWHLENPVTLNLGPAAEDDGQCSSIQLNCEGSLNFETAPRSNFHFEGNVYGDPKKYTIICYTLSYKNTGEAFSGKVVTTLPAIMFNLNVLYEANVRSQINPAFMNSSFD